MFMNEDKSSPRSNGQALNLPKKNHSLRGDILFGFNFVHKISGFVLLMGNLESHES